MSPSPRENVLPPDLVEACRRQTKQAFLEAYGDTQVLLIRLDNTNDELCAGLTAASTVSGERLKPTQDAIGFATVMAGPEAVERVVAPVSRRFDSTTLETQLVRHVHFAVPLRRRTARPFVEHISVGRAHNNDVVLRHSSVSKFHAWFECDEDRAFYLGDARSKNGTKLNGARLTSELERVHPGDEIRFGQVVATVCPPDALWDIVVRAA